MELKIPNNLYKIDWNQWRCMVILDILVYGRLSLLLGIFEICFTEYEACGMWFNSNGRYRRCQYQYIWDIYDSVNFSFIINNLQNFIGLNPFSNFWTVIFVTVSTLLDWILYLHHRCVHQCVERIGPSICFS